MDHSGFERIVPGSSTAVLMIHGIIGTPRHFDFLVPDIPSEWSVYNLLLPGHGGTVLDFGRSSMREWKGYAMDVFRDLCGKYRQIVLVGHSMGTLFSIRMALEKPEKVPFLFLLASPVKVGLKPIILENSLRVAFGKVCEDKPQQVATRDACSVQTHRRIWEYITWVPRYLELFEEIAQVRKLLPRLQVPSYVYQSKQDELVSYRSVKILRDSGKFDVKTLHHSAHFYYSEGDKQEIQLNFRELCKHIKEKTR